MAKFRDRTCKVCSKITYKTASKSEICAECCVLQKKTEKIETEKKHLISLGYKLVDKNIEIKNGHRHYFLITPCCLKETVMGYGNILKQLNLIGQPPCTFCGGETRIGKAMVAYIKDHGKDYDPAEFELYAKKVRRLSERKYNLHKNTLNPHNLKRGQGKNDYHLDHKTSIIFCFKNKISEIDASNLANLELLSRKDNLAKGKRNSNTIVEMPSFLKEFRNDSAFEIISDFHNVFLTNDKLIIRQSEIEKFPKAVLSRIKYKLGFLNTKIGARKLTVREVSEDQEKLFLNEWHVQGYSKSKMCFGLWKDDELISLMSFGEPRYKQKTKHLELIRFCNHGLYSVPGAANKLWQHFLKSNNSDVVSYSLNRWGSGEIYKILGFTKVSTAASPRYFWFNDQQIRSWRASVLKARRDGIDLKKHAIKINDPGTTTWKYSKKVL